MVNYLPLHLYIAISAVVGVAGAMGVVYSFYCGGRHRMVNAGSFRYGMTVVCIVVLAVGISASFHFIIKKSDPVYRWARSQSKLTSIQIEVISSPRCLEQEEKNGSVQCVKWKLEGQMHTFRCDNGKIIPSRAIIAIFARQWPFYPQGTHVRFEGKMFPADTIHRYSAAVNAIGRPQQITHPQGWKAYKQRIHSYVLQQVAHLSTPARALIPALTAGQRNSIPLSLQRVLAQVSLSHITVVSGFHISLVAAVVMAASGWLRRGTQLWVTCMCLGTYMVIVGLGASVIRAGIMAAIMLLGRSIGRPSHSVTALLITGIIMLIWDPFLSVDYGFALSIIATASIVIRVPVWQARLSRFMPRFLAQMIAVPLCAQLWCAPVLVLLGSKISLYAIAANVAVAAAIAPVIIASLCALICAGLPLGHLGRFIVAFSETIAQAGCQWIVGVAQFFHALPDFSFYWLTGPWGAVTLAVILGCAATIIEVHQPHIGVKNTIRRVVKLYWIERSRYRRARKHGTVKL